METPVLRIREGYGMKTIKKLWNYSCFDCYAFGILIAVELLMSFTFLGYLHIPPISVTIAYLPILARSEEHTSELQSQR